MINTHFHLLNTIDVSFFNLASVNPSWADGSADDYRDHARIDNLLFYSVSGERVYTINGEETLRIRENDILFAPAKSRYISKCKATFPQMRTSGICIKFDIKDEFGKVVVIDDAPQWVYHDMDGRLLKTFTDLHNAIMQGTGGKLFSKALLAQLMETLITNVRKDKFFGDSNKDILPALKKIEHYPQEKIKISDLADLCHLSESAFRRKFIQYAGITPVRYRNEIRIQKTLELLKSGLYTIEKAAEVMGFTDQAHLSNAIKKVTGKTPREIRGYIKNKYYAL